MVGLFFKSLFSKIKNLAFLKTEFGLFSVTSCLHYKLLATLAGAGGEGE